MTPQIQKERELPGGTMTDWNVVITAGDPADYRAARRKLRRLGEIERTDFHNVMVMRVCDVTVFLKTLEDMIEKDPGFLDDVSRIVPAHAAFDFVSVAEFETESRRIVSVGQSASQARLSMSDCIGAATRASSARLARSGFSMMWSATGLPS